MDYKKKKLVILKNDWNLLRWLWKWKLLSTSAIQAGIYKSKSKNRTYRRLLHFEKHGLIQTCYSDCRKYCLWLLTDKGYQFLQDFWVENFQKGFRSENKNHDFWVTVIHLGEWVTGIPKNCDLISEQELRRWDYEHFQDWVPRTSSHRPDGYWKTDLGKSNRDSLIALEVELSKKSPRAYKGLGHFYSNSISINEIIWVVKTKGDLNYIFRHLSSGSKNRAAEHSFLFLNQFIQHQWQAKIEFGKSKGKTLSEALGKRPESDGKERTGHFLLDLRKKPVVSTSSTLLKSSELHLSR